MHVCNALSINSPTHHSCWRGLNKCGNSLKDRHVAETDQRLFSVLEKIGVIGVIAAIGADVALGCPKPGLLFTLLLRILGSRVLLFPWLALFNIPSGTSSQTFFSSLFLAFYFIPRHFPYWRNSLHYFRCEKLLCQRRSS
jgi:hypothetical protein